MAKMSPRVLNAHIVSAALFLVPLLLVWLTLNSAFKIGGIDPGAESVFIYLLLWPLQIPLLIFVIYDVRQYLHGKSSSTRQK
jgi:hypothetical protein